MTFTYTPASPDDTTRVRYHIGDTVEASAIFTDEEIDFVISEEGSYQKAVVSLIQAVIAKIGHEPDFTADWLQVDWRRSVDAWRDLLAEKRSKFGIAARSARSVATYRSDSNQPEAPDW